MTTPGAQNHSTVGNDSAGAKNANGAISKVAIWPNIRILYKCDQTEALTHG